MKVGITSKVENKSLRRTEVKFNVADAVVTPSRKELLPKIAAMLNAKENLVVIEKISHGFGVREATGTARVYKEETALKAEEPHYMVGRNIGQKKKPGEKKAAKKKEAAAAKEKAPEKK